MVQRIFEEREYFSDVLQNIYQVNKWCGIEQTTQLKCGHAFSFVPALLFLLLLKSVEQSVFFPHF